MSRDQLIALKLRNDAHPHLAGALRPVVDRALTMIGEAVHPDQESPEYHQLQTRIDEFRTALAAAADPDSIKTLSDKCFALCQAAIDDIRSQHADRRAELARLVAVVRDTVTMLAGNGEAFTSDIAIAADRFSGLMQIRDVQQLKQALAAEVSQLQRIAAERQHQWRDTVSMFEARVAALETQLVAVREQAEVDPLTGIGNRRHFEHACREYMQLSLRQFVVAIFDLDDFKKINDTGGHPVGDEALRQVAKALKTSVRKEDVVARIGGDEFALMLAGVTLRQAESRLRAMVTSFAAIETGLDRPSTVSVSCGATEFTAGDKIESLMRRADQALYDAKRLGKNRLVVKTAPFIRDLMKR